MHICFASACFFTRSLPSSVEPLLARASRQSALLRLVGFHQIADLLKCDLDSLWAAYTTEQMIDIFVGPRARETLLATHASSMYLLQVRWVRMLDIDVELHRIFRLLDLVLEFALKDTQCAHVHFPEVQSSYLIRHRQIRHRWSFRRRRLRRRDSFTRRDG